MIYHTFLQFNLKNANNELFNKEAKDKMFENNNDVLNRMFNHMMEYGFFNKYKMISGNKIILSSLDGKKQLIMSCQGKYNSLEGDSLYFYQEKLNNRTIFTIEELILISHKIKKYLEYYLNHKINEPHLFVDFSYL